MSSFKPRVSSFAGRRLGPVMAVGLVLAGCAAGPDFVRPGSPSVSGYQSGTPPAQTVSTDTQAGGAQRFVAGMDLPGQWWTLFRSPQLNALVQAALEANPNLQAAEASLRQALELAQAQRGFYYPTVQAGFAPSRQSVASGTLSPNVNSAASLYNLYTAQVAVSYNVDVFGANRRQVEALQALADAQQYQLHAAYVTLTANVVAAAIQEASLRAQIDATQSLVDAQREQVRLFQRQFELGYVPQAEVVAQQAQLAQTQALLLPLKKQLAVQRNLLVALVGKTPDQSLDATFELGSLELPLELPLSIPSELVNHRPDVRAAEAQLHAASADVGVASANMLPSVTLTAQAGGVAEVLSQMFQSGNIFWAVGAGVTQTLFAGGTLEHRKRASVAAFEQAAAQYRSAVITAFQNVSDSLFALQFDAEALQAQAAAERAAAEGVSFATRSYKLGASSYLSLISAQQTYQQAVLALAQARANRYADTVALFQALGGGWWNDPPVKLSSR